MDLVVVSLNGLLCHRYSRPTLLDVSLWSSSRAGSSNRSRKMHLGGKAYSVRQNNRP